MKRHGQRRSKKKSQQSHATRRLTQRYGIRFTQKMQEDLRRMINNGEVRVLEKQSQRVTVCEVTYEGRLIRFAYDNKREQIATFLPTEAAE